MVTINTGIPKHEFQNPADGRLATASPKRAVVNAHSPAKLSTVTIGISAYNEEDNIGAVLRSLLDQTGEGFVVERILVLCDGCTDGTPRTVSELGRQFSLIEAVNLAERKGKLIRMNDLFRSNQSDVLITLDADIAIPDPHFVEKMVRVLREDSGAVLATAHQVPLRAPSFQGSVIHAIYQYFDRARLAVPNYEHIENVYGAGIALKRVFIENLQIPPTVLGDSWYLFLRAHQVRGFRYVKDAAVYYRAAGTIREFRMLMQRVAGMRLKLAQGLGEEVTNLFALPFRYKVRALTFTLWRSPVRMTLGVMVILWTKLFPLRAAAFEKNNWQILPSTKKAIRSTELPPQ